MNYDEMEENIFDELFWDIVNKECVYLNKYNPEYKKYGKLCSKIVGENKKIQLVIENDEPVALNEEDVEQLIEYIRADGERNILEHKRMLFAGAKYAYYFFEKMNLLKKLESDSSED